MRIRKAVIPAAGLGTRLLPATKAQPKEMLPVVDTPVIQLVVEEAILSGIKDIIIITGKGKRAIEDHFDTSVYSKQHASLVKLNDLLKKVKIHYTRQDEPLGLGHSVLQAEQHIGNEPFVVLLGDDFYIGGSAPATKQLIEQYNKLGASVIAVEQVNKEKVIHKGMVITENIGNRAKRIIDVIEKPKLEDVTSTMVISGRYILPPQIFRVLHTIKPGRGGELQLTDAIKHLILSEAVPFYAYELDGKRLDVGNPLDYLKAILFYAKSREDLKKELQIFLNTFNDS